MLHLNETFYYLSQVSNKIYFVQYKEILQLQAKLIFRPLNSNCVSFDAYSAYTDVLDIVWVIFLIFVDYSIMGNPNMTGRYVWVRYI
jgi:hypothetical protein